MRVILFLLGTLLIAGCAAQSTQELPSQDQLPQDYNRYSSPFGFSFAYPLSWSEHDQAAPERWAIRHSDNSTILFTTNEITTTDLLVLGQTQALRDTKKDLTNVVGDKQLEQVQEIVQVSRFGDHEWYTYAMAFDKPNVSTIISGTVCNTKELTMVLVSPQEVFDYRRETYTALLESFTCS